MTIPVLPNQEVLLSLAEEIRQTIQWFHKEKHPRMSREILHRLQTLKEAAKAAGLNSVISALEDLDQELGRQQPSRESPEFKTERILSTLSSAVASVAASVQAQEMQWVEQIQKIETTLESSSNELNRRIFRLSDKTLLVDACAAARNDEDRTRLLEKLARELKSEVSHQRTLQGWLEEAITDLRDISRKLIRQLSHFQTFPLSALIAKLENKFQTAEKKNGHTISWNLQGENLDIGIRQLEPLERVLAKFLDGTQILSPIEAKQGKNLLTLTWEERGNQAPHPPGLSSSVRKDLGSLRGRVLQEEVSPVVRRITIQIPTLYNIIEVTSAQTSIGEILIPLNTVAEVFDSSINLDRNLSVITLERRMRNSLEGTEAGGVIFDIEGRRAVMFADIAQASFWIYPSAPALDDPWWVIARANDGNGSRRLMHPLSVIPLEKGQSCIFPVGH